ncbi:MAG: 30S ribosomal protein S8e [Candidatus Iainarchaeum archaeon]|uniref:30S ribosomal protein S8e n=1 Tax=Candidatus Iainarchaeum sp. TaxID=3101447 RepID=A0A7T9I0U2_9ARCH|nr:MAG: 30S ribosomal protein S8e [Candidatus Diapherotrites archaeon]
MTQWHLKSARKETGGLRNSVNGKTKRLYTKGGDFTTTTMADASEMLVAAGRGKTSKAKLRKASVANVTDPKSKKTTKMKIIWVHENKANRLYVRRNIITKGTEIEVEANGSKHYAQVTSRPGQDGSVNAVLRDTAPASVEAKAAKAAKTSSNKKTAAATPAPAAKAKKAEKK